jgi:hypothetical protein
MTDRRHENHSTQLGFEREDLGAKPVVGFIISVVVTGVLIYYVLWGVFHFLDAYDRKHQQNLSPLVHVEQDTRSVRTTDIQRFPQPRLEESERTELNDFRYSEEEQLNSAGWIDEKAGIAHIPITRAMELVAERGLPTTPAVGQLPPSPVNLAREAAAASDTSEMKAAPPKPSPQGKKQ